MIQYCCVDIDTSKIALLLNPNRNTINRWHGLFRQAMLLYQESSKGQLVGKIERYASYFGAKRQRGFKSKARSLGAIRI